MRTIDADALWKDITRNIDYCDDILEIIEKQPTIEQKSQWIPCSKYLPYEYGNYLVLTQDGEIDIGTIGYEGRWSLCDANGFYWADTRGLVITAWMPLPEPYSEDEE